MLKKNIMINNNKLHKGKNPITTFLLISFAMIGISQASVSDFSGAFNVIGAVDLDGQISKVIGIFSKLGLILTFGAFLFAGFAYMTGRSEMAIVAFVGAIIMGLAWVFTKFLYEAGTGETYDVDLDVMVPVFTPIATIVSPLLGLA